MSERKQLIIYPDGFLYSQAYPAYNNFKSKSKLITGTYEYILDPSDPWPQGYRLADTWPAT